MHTHSPDKLRKLKQTSARKLRETIFWNRKGVLMMEFMQQGMAIMSEVYCQTVLGLVYYQTAGNGLAYCA
jgi:hypothetical protein